MKEHFLLIMFLVDIVIYSLFQSIHFIYKYGKAKRVILTF